jgi:hypothetical protein
VWIGFDWFRIAAVARCCECGDEVSGFYTTEIIDFMYPSLSSSCGDIFLDKIFRLIYIFFFLLFSIVKIGLQQFS